MSEEALKLTTYFGERTRLGNQDFEPDTTPGVACEGLKLTVFVGRHERVDGSPAFAAICDLLQDCGVSGATALLRSRRRQAR